MFHRTALIVMLVLLAFPAPGNSKAKAVEAFCSIVAFKPAPYEDSGNRKLSGYLLGGWSRDGWLANHVAASLLRGGETYRFYSLDKEVGAGTGSSPHPFGEENDPCHDTLAVSF